MTSSHRCRKMAEKHDRPKSRAWRPDTESGGLKPPRCHFVARAGVAFSAQGWRSWPLIEESQEKFSKASEGNARKHLSRSGSSRASRRYKYDRARPRGWPPAPIRARAMGGQSVGRSIWIVGLTLFKCWSPYCSLMLFTTVRSQIWPKWGV